MTQVMWVAAGGAIPALPADTALVWHGRLDAASPLVARAALTTDDLADLAHRPHAEWGAARRRISRALLAAVAEVHPDGIILSRSCFGALGVISPAGWYISMAGQHGWCAIALARVPVGVDIEPLDQCAPPADLFSARELREGGDRLARWTLKEAHAKRFGRADIAEPQAIETDLSGEPPIATSAGGASHCFLHRAGGAIVAVALPA